MGTKLSFLSAEICKIRAPPCSILLHLTEVLPVTIQIAAIRRIAGEATPEETARRAQRAQEDSSPPEKLVGRTSHAPWRSKGRQELAGIHGLPALSIEMARGSVRPTKLLFQQADRSVIDRVCHQAKNRGTAAGQALLGKPAVAPNLQN